MTKAIDAVSKVLEPFANFMNNNKFMTVIRNALALTISMIMIGSFATLFDLVLCSENGLAKFIPVLANYSNIFTMINYACVSCLSLFVVFLIGYQLGEMNRQKPFITALLAMACFMVQLDTETLSGQLGAGSLFLAILVSVLSVQIFTGLMKFEKIKIKLPATVPSTIADQFNSIIPAAITVILFGTVSGVIVTHFAVHTNDLIYRFIQAPFLNLAESQLGITIIVIAIMLCWWFGLHGNMALKPVVEPLFAASLASNMAQIAAGEEATHFATKAFQHTFYSLGGTGIVISLAIAILLFSKREDYREVTKASFIPLLVGISEPMVFGIPIMLNPSFLIPFILAPVVSVNIGYYLCQTGFLKNSVLVFNGSVPIGLQSFMEYGGQWQSIVAVVIVIVVSILIYTPFVIMDNRNKNKEDANE